VLVSTLLSMTDSRTASTSVTVIEQVPIGDSYDLRKRKREDGFKKYAEDHMERPPLTIREDVSRLLNF
jgi:hypothetical protein